MIALDTNILVHAHRADSRFHEAALRCVRELAEGREAWGIPWPCVHEFIGVVTHPRIFQPPSPMELALDQVAAWLESPSLALLGEDAGYFERLSAIAVRAGAIGPRIHDARVAALCLLHGVSELWSADRDFGRFPELTVRNPLIA